LDTVLLVTRASWRHLQDGGGAIVNFASVIAWMAIDLSPVIAHAAGKGGVLAMTRMLAREGAPDGIRANTISPGFVITDATRAAIDDEAWATYAREKSMLKRFGQPDDIAWAALYLVSDEASWVTGADFRIDGGWTAW
jgi:NAD(P)-dependent dehydrogenase (short-subunit alcohol dehydrogenase family)